MKVGGVPGRRPGHPACNGWTRPTHRPKPPSPNHQVQHTMRKKRGRPLDGWLIIDKPPGLTSTDVVNKVRRGFDAQKAGHGGTLDPLATGVLPIAFGHATKTVPYVMDGTKLYRFTLRLGEARDTDDADGQVVAHLRRCARPTTQLARRPARASPATSCRSRRSTPRSRSPASAPTTWPATAAPPDLPPRPARVDRFELIERPDADTAVFEVQSGKGVYMRSLARDLALACGTLGHIAALRRLRVGPFTEAASDFAGQMRARGGYPAALPRTSCFRSRPRWPTSRRWP